MPAFHFLLAPSARDITTLEPYFTTCCAGSSVSLPARPALPPTVQHLYTAQDAASKRIRANIRSFNITDFDDFSTSAAAYYIEHWAT